MRWPPSFLRALPPHTHTRWSLLGRTITCSYNPAQGRQWLYMVTPSTWMAATFGNRRARSHYCPRDGAAVMGGSADYWWFFFFYFFILSLALLHKFLLTWTWKHLVLVLPFCGKNLTPVLQESGLWLLISSSSPQLLTCGRRSCLPV